MTDWGLAFKRGQINLEDAIFLHLQAGLPETEYLLDRYVQAIESYKSGEIADLAEPFGIAAGKREKNAMERKTWVSHVRFHVDSFHEQGFTKQDPSQWEETAFHKTAKLLHKSPSQIFDTYYGR